MTVARYVALSLISRYHCLDPTNRDISGLHCIIIIIVIVIVIIIIIMIIMIIIIIIPGYAWLAYGCGKIFWHPFRWPWVKVTKLPKRDTIYIVPMVKW